MKRFAFRACLAGIAIFFFILLIGVSGAASAIQSDNVLWSQTYAGNDGHSCMAIARTTDGGYVIGGQSYNGTIATAYMARTDEKGSLRWINNSIPGSNAFYDVTALPDGSFAFVGSYGGVSTGSIQQGLLVKTDADGRQVFARTYGAEGDLYLSRVLAADDGNLMVLGLVSNISEGGTQRSYVYLLKIDAAGNALWSRLYGGAYGLNCQGFANAAAGGYAIAGSVTNIERGSIEAYLLMVDRNGDRLWDAHYPGPGYITIASLCSAGDDGFLLGGGISNGRTNDIYVLRVASNGTYLWNRTYEAKGIAYDVLPGPDGGFVLACGWNVTVLDSSGGAVWTRDFGTGEHALNCITEAADGSYVFGGWTEASDGNVAQWLIGIGSTKGSGATCWPAITLPLIAVAAIAIRRRRLR